MIIAHFFFCKGYLIKRHANLALLTSISIVACSLFIFNRLGGWVEQGAWKGLWHTYEAIIFAFLIFAYIANHKNIFEFVRNFLNSFGTVSYSMYLLHMPILVFIANQGLYCTFFNSLYINALATSVYALPIVFWSLLSHMN